MASIDIMKNYGIPPRPPPSTALWAHLLRKEPLASPPNSEIVPPPLAPFDKNGTSMRILLHDTQGNIEKFSARVDGLCSAVEEAKQEVATANALFLREHENLTGDMIDLVNRSQKEIQKSICSPAQAVRLEQLSKDIDRQLEALDKRIDAIQVFNQTHSQTLQIQSQALQTIQDQQASMIAALMPILPLLQAIPLHIESARNNINDTFSKSAVALARATTPPAQAHTTGQSSSASRTQRTKRSSSTLRSDGLPSSPLLHKRPRVDSSEFIETLGQPLRTPSHFEITGGEQESRDYLRQQNLPHSQRTPGQASRQGSYRQAYLSNISKIPQPTARRRPMDTNARRPFADLLMASYPNTESHPLTRASMLESQTLGTTDQRPVHSFSSPRFLGITPSAERPPRSLRVHSMISQAASTDATSTSGIPASNFSDSKSLDDKIHLLQDSTLTSTHNQKNGKPLSHTALVSAISSSSRLAPTIPSSPVSPSIATVNHDTRKSLFQTSHISAAPASRLAPTVPSSPVAMNTGDRIPGQEYPLFSLPQAHLISPRVPLSPHQRAGLSNMHVGQDAPNMPKTNRPWIKPAPVIKVRERRSPFREGRRFIPLADSDDDEDDEDSDG